MSAKMLSGNVFMNKFKIIIKITWWIDRLKNKINILFGCYLFFILFNCVLIHWFPTIIFFYFMLITSSKIVFSKMVDSVHLLFSHEFVFFLYVMNKIVIHKKLKLLPILQFINFTNNLTTFSMISVLSFWAKKG